MLSPEDIKFFIDHDEDFLKPISIEPHFSKMKNYWFHNTFITGQDNINTEVFCDYLLHFKNLSNYSLNFLTKHLLNYKPDFILSLPKNGFHILHKAMEKENYELVELLLQFGFDINSVDGNNKTIFIHEEKILIHFHFVIK